MLTAPINFTALITLMKRLHVELFFRQNGMTRVLFLLVPHIVIIVWDVENDFDRLIKLVRKTCNLSHGITLQTWIGRTAILVIEAFVFE
jgi:hypothetical protein